MSQITLTIIGEDGTVHDRPHASLVDFVVAALSADPETLSELEAAAARFMAPDNWKGFSLWSRGMCDQPYDSGICVVDLPARVIATCSTYASPSQSGQVLFGTRDDEQQLWLPYHLSDDWVLYNDLPQWEGAAKSRTRERQAAAAVNVREVLYTKVCQFIVEECRAAVGGASTGDRWSPPAGWAWEAIPERAAAGQTPSAADAVAEIHARWLLRPRPELRGASPRDALLRGKHHLDRDLQDRSRAWTTLGDCPPGLSEQSAAYRRAAFGGHENIMYYELVRHLVWECWERVVEEAIDSQKQTDDDVAWLHQVKKDWLAAPQAEDLRGRTPEYVIERERSRLPMAVSGTEAMIDDDCPLCQMMADDLGPVFWCLDGCNMDDDFPFSFHTTHQQWEDERRDWEEFDRKFDQSSDSLLAGPSLDDTPVWEDAPDDESPIWERSFADPEADGESPLNGLFGIGACLAELTTDLKTSDDSRRYIDILNRHFGNLRAAIREPSAALLDPVVERLRDELYALAEIRPDVARKCDDLQQQLADFAAALTAEADGGEGDDNISF